MRKILAIFVVFVFANAGNLSELINLAQSAKSSEFLKFSQNVYKKNALQKALNFDVSGRYTMIQKQGGGYTTKSGSMLVRFEYLLFDGGESEAVQKIASYENASEIYKSEAYKNLISLQVGKIYFNALAIDKLILNKQSELNALNFASIDSDFFYEFSEIDAVEFEAINIAKEQAKAKLDELYLIKTELVSRVNMLSNGELDFVFGSSIKMPVHSNKLASAKLRAKGKDMLILEQNAQKESSKLVPKIYIKDQQSLNDANFKKDGASNSELARRYLDSNKPLMELKWNLPTSLSKSTQQQRLEVEYQKAALALNDEQMASFERLQTLFALISELEAKVQIALPNVQNIQQSIESLAKTYAMGRLGYAEFLFLLGDNVAWLNAFVLDKDELEIRKLEYYFERGDEILKMINP